jgi:hypothetical protein
MRSLKPILAAALAFGLALPAQAAFDKGGVLGVGARPTGMGSAFVAIADDSTAIHWNPAGMVQLSRMELSGFFGPLLNGKEYYMSGAFVMPFLEQTAVGLSIVSLYHDTGNPDTNAYENTFLASFATPLNVEKTVSFGVNLKFLQYDSAAKATIPSTGVEIQAKAGAVGMDIGALYQVLLPNWGKKVSFGFLAQDLDTVLRWQSGVEERVPLLVQAGVAYFPEENLAFAVDYSFFNDTNISGQPLNQTLFTSSGTPVTTLEPDQHRPHVGIEGWFFNGHLGLRTGYTGFATTADRFTGGVSYRQDWYGVDYGYMGHAEHLGDSHRLSGHVDFGGGKERPRVVALVNPPSSVQGRPNNNSVQLQWEPNPDPHVTGYTVYMSKASGSNYVPIQKRIKENKVIIDGLTNGQRYYFVVTAVNNSWPSVESNYSSEVSAVPAPQIPTAPGFGGEQEAAPAPVANGVLTARGWPVPTGRIKGYNLYISETSGSGFKKVNDSMITGPTYLVQGLEPNKMYFIRVTSLSDSEPPVESSPSVEQQKMAEPGASLPPQAPAPGGAK